MTFSVVLTLGIAAALLPKPALTSWFGETDVLVSRGNSGCGFNITSPSFPCPAGQLPDGQIRFDGTEDTANFYIGSDGGITDSNGYGCIVTAPPTTQIQCDKGAAPTQGFSIDSNDNLSYKGSSTFYACPATNIEYNIYVNPNFGQAKCFPINLKASGCGAAASATCPLPTTVWQTQTVTQGITQTVSQVQTVTQDNTKTVTITQTNTELCVTSSPPPSTSHASTTSDWNNSTTICHHCTKSSSSWGA